MLILNGESLGQRQKDLNLKVNEAVKSKVNVKHLKSDAKELDADVLFKIDVAAKIKNIDYIIDILKCGDELYISRALKKCKWLGDKEFEEVINIEYLKLNVFPHMSNRMKKKLICTLQFYLKNNNIIIDFYTYCYENKLFNEASKFLLIANEEFKYQVIVEHKDLPRAITGDRDNYVRDFLKDSYPLLEMYLGILITDEHKKYSMTRVLHAMRHMFLKSDERYLNLMETYGISPNLGNRHSKHLMEKYKHRVLRNPLVYLKSISKSVLVKYSNVEDAKTFATVLFQAEPHHQNYGVYEFHSFYITNKHIIDIIPKGLRYSFLKNMFHRRYPHCLFEMDKNFYHRGLYEIMTEDEKESWAMCHIESKEEILGIGNDYLWYQFLSFNKAFEPIKKFIMLTPEREKRLTILKILIHSVRTPNDMQVLLDHFYARHVNEMKHHKEDFLNALISNHDVLNFTKDCWTALEKIFYSLYVFDTQKYNTTNSDYRNIALLYYIVNNITVPDFLNELLELDAMSLRTLKGFCKTAEQKQILYDYLLQFYIGKLQILRENPYINVKKEINAYAKLVLDLLESYTKTKDDIPEIVSNFISLDPEHFQYHRLLVVAEHFDEDNIKRYLKQDCNLLITEFDKIKEFIRNDHCRYEWTINWTLRKLKIYFPVDIGQQFLKILVKCLSDPKLNSNLAKVSVFGIYTLADESSKLEFLAKYQPKEGKIDHVNIPRDQLYVQEALCRLVHYSRPHIPLQKFLPYMIGDYIHFCLPIFNAYRTKLPMPQCLDFVEAVLNKPVSIQKHGIRIAFTCFSLENLIKMIDRAWGKTKNVSVRKVIYEALFNKTTAEYNHYEQNALFEQLLKLTSSLNEDDDDAVFGLLCTCRLPRYLDSKLIITGWNTINTFPVKAKKYQRLASIIRHMGSKLELIPDEVLDPIVDSHVNELLKFEKLPDKPHEMVILRSEIQDLLTSYVILFKNNEQLQKRSKLVKLITESSFSAWSKLLENKYVVKQFVPNFLNDIQRKCYEQLQSHTLDGQYMNDINSMFTAILNNVLRSLPESETFTLIWDLRLNIIKTKLIADTLENGKPGNIHDLATMARNAVLRLATEFTNLIKEYKSRGKYNKLFQSKMERSIDDTVKTSISAINDYWKNSDNLIRCKVQFDSNDAHIAFCEHLLDFNNKDNKDTFESLSDEDTKELALSLVNQQLLRNSKSYSHIIDKIKNIQDDKLQSFIFHKFVSYNYEPL